MHAPRPHITLASRPIPWLILLAIMSTAAPVQAQWGGEAHDYLEEDDVLLDTPRPQPATGTDTTLTRTEVDAAYVNRPLGRIDFSCDLDLCQSPVAVERFKEMSGLYIGQPYSSASMERAKQRLAKTGFFHSLQVEKELIQGHVFISIEAQGAVLIRKVKFLGLSPPPFETDLRKILIYRQGQPYTEDGERASAQLASLEAVYQREGYFGTEITMVVEPVDGEPHLVDLTFRVQKGDELKICDIGIRGNRAMSYSQARELLLTGVAFLSRRVPLFAPTYTTQNFRAGRDALLRRYREMGYFRARIVNQSARIDHATSCVLVAIDLVEGPHWEMSFEGNQHFTNADLLAQLPFFDSGYVDREEIRRAQNAIRKLYETRGYPFAQVEGVETQIDARTRTLAFEIREGPQLQIKEVVLHGNDNLKRDLLTANFGTQPFGLFDAGGYLQTDQLLADFSKLENVYRQHGYLQATVERFALEIISNGSQLRVHIYINEGVRTRADRLEITGTRVVPQGTLQALVQVGRNSPFVPLHVRADQARIVQRYSSFGYPLAQVTTTCRLLTGEEVACEAPQLPQRCRATVLEDLEELCRWETEPNPTRLCSRLRQTEECVYEGGAIDEFVRVRHHIDEGPLVRVGEIFLKGNFVTVSDLIYRELPLKTGDLFDTRKVIEGQGNMRSLGLFDSVSIEAIGLDDSDRGTDEITAALVISVEESRSIYMDFRVGVEGRDLLDEGRRLLLTGEAQYNNSNFWGRGGRLRPRLIAAIDAIDLWRVGADATQELDATREVTELDYLVGVELIYNHPRFLKGWTKIDKLFLTITPFYMLDLVGVTYDQLLREEWGLRLELRKELFEVMERLFLTFGIEAKQSATWSPTDLRIDGERIFSPRRTTAKLMPEITLDRRDSPLNPKHGYHIQIQPQLVSGDALAQGGEDAIGDSYLRLIISASAYIPLWRDVILGQGVRVGQIVPLFGRQALVPPDERFFLGGVASLRGFATNALGPLGGRQQTIGGEFLMNYTAELRYPLLRNINLYGATFFDAGLLTNCYDDGNTRTTANCYENAFPEGAPWSQIRTAGGLGLRYLLVDQIPLLFDYAFVLNRRPGENFGSLHFNLGYSF